MIQVMQSSEGKAEQTRSDRSPSIFSLSLWLTSFVTSPFIDRRDDAVLCLQAGRDNVVTRRCEGHGGHGGSVDMDGGINVDPQGPA